MGDLLGDIPDRPTWAVGDALSMTSVQLRYSGPAGGFRWQLCRTGQRQLAAQYDGAQF